MDVLVFLKRIRSERLEILRLDMRRADLRDTLLPAGIRYDKDKVQTSPSDRMLEVAGQLSEIEDRLLRRSDRLTKHVRLAYEMIEQVQTPEYRELLELRYLVGGDNPRQPMQWTEVADRMGYSLDHVKGKLHGKAIMELRKVWDARDAEHKRTRENT